MKVLSLILSTAMAAAFLIGCGQQEEKAPTTKNTTAPAAAETHTHADGSTHGAHEEAEAAHSHSDDHGHSHGGEQVALGAQQVLGFTVTAKREGEVTAGKEAVFLIETTPAAEAVRLWVGDEEATNSVRSKADGGPTSFHAHTMVPGAFAAEAALWVEVQNANGERGAVSFGLNGAATDDHSHSDGDHSHDHGDHGHSH